MAMEKQSAPGNPVSNEQILSAAAGLLGLSVEQLKAALASLRRPNHDKLLSRREAAKYLNLDYTTVKAWADAGKIPQYKMGYKTVKYKQSDLDALLESSAFKPKNKSRPPLEKPE